ncbi:hypothetical protein [Dyadobacter sp. CY345]|nr:hypothetical protein [Dyadobacter sp. CY345]
MKFVVKFGTNNFMNKEVYQAYCTASIGAVYYAAITFDELLP